jgi:hypothetical protein
VEAGAIPAAAPTGGEPSADPTGSAPTPPAGGESPQADPRVIERMAQTIEQLPSMLERAVAPQPAEPAEPPIPTLEEILSGEYAQQPPNGQPSYADPYGDPYGQVGQEQAPPGVDPAVFAQAVRAEAQRIADPLQQRLDSLETRISTADVDALEQQLPGFADPEVKQDVVLRAVQHVNELGLSDEQAKQVLYNPRFLRTMYFAREAELRAQSEIPAGGSELGAVESAHGASPAQPEGDPGDAIVAARRPNGGFNF